MKKVIVVSKTHLDLGFTDYAENIKEKYILQEKKAYMIEKNMPQEGILKVLAMAKADREDGKQVLIVNMKKNKKFQKDQLIEDGYTDIKECYRDNI